MTSIFDLFSFARNIAAKGDTQFIQPQFFSEALDAAQLSLFNAYRTSGTLDNLTQDALAPFVTDYDFSSSSVGHFTRPMDYAQSLRVVSTLGEHTPILFNEMRDAVTSALYPIEQYPRFGEAGNYLVLYPQQILTGTLTYYRNPAKPVVGYTLDADNDFVYDAGASTQLEFPKAYWMDILIKALQYVGVNLSDGEIAALAAQNEGRG